MANNFEIMISYSSKDESLVNRIKDYLQNKKLNCWVAHAELNTMDIWPAEITKAIAACEIFVVILTEESNTSNQVMRELTIADKFNKKLYFFQVHELNISDGITYFCTANQRNEAWKIGIDKGLDKMAKELPLNLRKPLIQKKTTIPRTKTEILKEAEILSKNEKVTKEDLKKVKGTGSWVDSDSGGAWGCLFWIVVFIGGYWIYQNYFNGNPEYNSHIADGKKEHDRKVFALAKWHYLKAYNTPNITRKDSIEAALLISFCDFNLKKYDTARINLYSIIAIDDKNAGAYLYLGFVMDKGYQKTDSALYFYSKSIEVDSTNPFYAYYNRAVLKQKINDVSANDDYKKAKEIDPSKFKELTE